MPEEENTNLYNHQELPSAFDLFTPSSEAVRRNLGSFIGVMALPSLYMVVAAVVLAAINNDRPPLVATIILYTIGGLLGLLLLPANPYLQLYAAKGETCNFIPTVKKSLQFFWRILGLYIVVGLVILGGFLLFIVPGVIMVRRYYLSPYFLIDRNLSIGQAMRQSAEATGDHTGAIWGIIGVQILLEFASLIPLIGSLVALALEVLYACAPALRYLQFTRQPSPLGQTPVE